MEQKTMEKNKYYIPEIADFFVGYTFEYLFSFKNSNVGYVWKKPNGDIDEELTEEYKKSIFERWIKTEFLKPFRNSSLPIAKFTPEDFSETIDVKSNYYDSPKNIEEIYYLIKDSKIRTKYLDQTDIESLGWRYNEKHDSYTITKSNESGYSLKNHIIWNGATPTGKEWMIDDTGYVLYKGDVKSINELKLLMKFLNIK